MEFEDLHLITLACTAIAILYSDHLAYGYFRGKQLLLEAKVLHRLHIAVWIGLVGMIITGIGLFLPMSAYLLGEPTFYVKIAFVLTLVFNAWVIGKIQHVATERPFAALTTKEQRFLIISGAISGISWISAALIGFFFL